MSLCPVRRRDWKAAGAASGCLLRVMRYGHASERIQARDNRASRHVEGEGQARARLAAETCEVGQRVAAA
jgi:hypothetical protein